MIYVLVIYNFFRFILKRLIYGYNIKINNIQRISPFTSIRNTKTSKIKLGYNICISKFGDIFVGSNGDLNIGNRVYFNRGVFISCQSKITIEDNCQFGPDVKIIDNNHKFSKEYGVSTKEHSYGEIYIGENSWIGSNVVLLKNAKIGKRCVIGAGCIINSEIPESSIVTLSKDNIVIEPIRENK